MLTITKQILTIHSNVMQTHERAPKNNICMQIARNDQGFKLTQQSNEMRNSICSVQILLNVVDGEKPLRAQIRKLNEDFIL